MSVVVRQQTIFAFRLITACCWHRTCDRWTRWSSRRCLTVNRRISGSLPGRSRHAPPPRTITLTICRYVCLLSNPLLSTAIKTIMSLIIRNCTQLLFITKVFLLFAAVYTIRYDNVYLTCSKKLTGSQHSLLHGINKKLKCETKNKMMSVIGPVQSRCHEGSPV